MSTARDLANVLADLLRREHHALADFLAALADFDGAGRWVELGHASLFAFLVKDLGLSSGAAAYRRAAVELIRRFPQVLEAIRERRLCITTVFELSKVLTEENVEEVLPRFFGASKRDAQNVVAELAPVPAPVRTVVTPVRAATTPLALPPPSADWLADCVRANSESGPQEERGFALAMPATARAVIEPKTAELSSHEPLHAPEGRELLGAGRGLGGEGPCGASAANGDDPPAQGPTTSPAPAPAASQPGRSRAPSGHER